MRRCLGSDSGCVVGFMCLILMCFCVQISLGSYETSWYFYNEGQCCLTEAHHGRKDFVSQFSCGKMFYKTLHIDDKTGYLYIGGMDHVYRLQTSDINKTDCKKDSLFLEATDVTECIVSGKSENYECRNHIRIIEDIGDSMLYICGTNAHNPRDLIIYKDLKHLPRHVHRARVGRGTGRCSPSPTTRSCSLLTLNPGAMSENTLLKAPLATENPYSNTPEQGPPLQREVPDKKFEEDFPSSTFKAPVGTGSLHAASRASAGSPDPLYARWDLLNTTTHHGYLRTLKYDTKWMDNPEFISIQQFGNYTYLFMREKDPCNPTDGYSDRHSAVSVAARVCSADRGGSKDKRHWTTYAKARITCLTPHYDQLESIYRVPEDNHLYAIFTSGIGSVMKGSVVCSFSSSALDRPFQGPFSDWSSGERSRFAVQEDRVPNPRPGMCVKDTTKLPDSVVNFLKSHPLMYESIVPEFDGPIYIQKYVIFTVFVVDKVFNNLGNFTVFYAGTNDGRIFKIVQYLAEGKGDSFLQDIWKVFPDNEAVVAMVMSRSLGSLYVTSDRRVVQVTFSGVCRNQYDGCVRCIRDPYCGWSRVDNTCLPYETRLLQDVADVSKSGCDELIRPKQVSTTFGQSVHLGNYLNLPEVVKNEDFIWTKYDRDKGRHEIIERSGKYILTAGRGLVVVGLTHQDRGLFECRQGKRLVALYNVMVDSNRCSTPSQNGSYHRVYLDWCREFMKHKEAMDKWQSKTKQCKKYQLDWNKRSNEVLQDYFRN